MTTKLRTPFSAALSLACAAALFAPAGVLGAPSAEPASTALQQRDTTIDDSGLYRSEVQACLSGRTPQSRETCLEEARNARADKQRGRLEAGYGDYTANALARCQPFTGDDRAACEARVMGFGPASGSVEGGGILRSVEMVIPPARAAGGTPR